MELQQIIVIAIVCLCTIWISIRIFQYFKRIKNNSNPCECCSSDCAMKSMQNKPKYGCEKNAEKVRKKIAEYLQIKKNVVPLQPQSRNKQCFKRCPDGGIGRRAGLKHQWIHFHPGSTPGLGTKIKAK